MGQALYRKYRSKKLSEIVGQEHITATLGQALKTGRISHAYLFTGPHGVGKTSVARILAHEINEIPYDDASSHIDIIEIDAASNRRIDEIRELREKVYVAPTSAKYKVYIIDEVHMLTREAFNALLKTLEEPPAHVVFILATTDAHKLPETIVSRTQRFSFKPVDKSKVVMHLRYIADNEKIDVSDEALELLAEHGAGSFRDSISLLDQASNQNRKLELQDVLSLLGIPPKKAIVRIISLLTASDKQIELMHTLSDLSDQGYQAAIIAAQISTELRAQLINDKLTMPFELALALLNELIEVSVSPDPTRLLEIILLKAIHTNGLLVDNIPKTVPDVATEKVVNKSTPSPKILAPIDKAVKLAENEQKEIEKKPNDADKDKPSSDTKAVVKANDDIWPNVLAVLKQNHNTLYGIVRMAQPEFLEDGSLRLTFSFAFHKKRIEEAKNQNLLASIMKEISGQNIAIECILSTDSKTVPKAFKETTTNIATKDEKSETDDLIAISAIFGGGELLES